MTMICPLCKEEPVTTFPKIWENPRLLDLAHLQYPKWQPDEGMCKSCLRDLERLDLREEKTVVVSAQHLIRQAAVPTEACLITIHGSDFGKKFTLNKSEMTIGRGESIDIRIASENVSRQHAKIVQKEQTFVLEDLNSTNGTFVNTKKVTETTLRDGDLILIGNTILKFISGSNIENQYYEEIYKLATLDGLTHAFNKKFFLNRLDEEFGRSRRYGRNLSVVLFDLDHFHKLNNTYGHIAGDFVLKHLARMILRNLRKEDLFGRFGGEEFAILLPETPQKDVLYLAEKIRKLVEETEFNYDGTSIRVTISLGIAYSDEKTENWKELLEKADEAMYRAKADGRNLVRS